MLLWVFRVIFLIVVVGVLLVSATSDVMTDPRNATSWWAMVISGTGMMIFVFFLDFLTPKKNKKKLSALAGVFIGLLVGMLISKALAPAVDMIDETYRIELITQSIGAIKWMLGICICFLTISIGVKIFSYFPFYHE